MRRARVASLVALVAAASLASLAACRPGDPQDPKTPPNSPLPEIDRPKEPIPTPSPSGLETGDGGLLGRPAAR